MTQVREHQGLFQEQLDRLISRASHHGPSWLEPLRRHALCRFNALGWPTVRDENWRFTNINPITRTSFSTPTDDPDTGTSVLIPFLAGEPDQVQLVFVNGIFRPDLSQTADLPRGVEIKSLGEAIQEDNPTLKSMITRLVSYERDSFAALNTAFMEQGLFLKIEPNIRVEKPIHLFHIAAVGSETPIYHPRNLIVAAENSEVSVIETHVAREESTYCANMVTELSIGNGAKVRHFLREHQSEKAFHIGTLKAHLGRGSRFESHNLLMGGALVRNNIRVSFLEEGGEATVNGLFLGHGKQHIDNDILIDHASPHCNSEQFFKGILDDEAHGIFTGRVLVREDAQKTDAAQTNRNLLLSEKARVDAKPQLEIYADDVKCAHGATTGHIDEEALFYLQTRGLDPKFARDLLLYAFAHEVIEQIPLEEERHQAEYFLFKRFSKAKLM